MRRGTVVVALGAGRAVYLPAYLAVTPGEHERGLLDVPTLAPGEALAFLFAPAGWPSFHTVGLRAPIDVVFSARGRVHAVVRGVPPGRRRVEAVAPSDLVLELLGGTADRLGLGSGGAVRVLDAGFPARY